MLGVSKNNGIITQKCIWAFQQTLNKVLGNSIFFAFLDADKYNENGEEESNLSGSYKDKFELIENSFSPAYRVDKDLFESTFT